MGKAGKVREFNKVYGVEINDKPSMNTDWELSVEILREEFEEYIEACKNGDIVEVADAIGDMDYIINGLYVKHGIDPYLCFDEIHRSNMSKLGEDGKPIRREDGKILKGKNYFKPDIKKCLEKQGKLAFFANNDYGATMLVDKALDIACEEYGLSPDELFEKIRKPEISLKRQSFWYLLYNRGVQSVYINRALDKIESFDRTTRYYGCNVIEKELTFNSEIMESVERMESKLKLWK